MVECIISVDDVTKKIGEQTILDHITLDITKGSIVGIIGRNGSGKTVLFKCICGFMKPSSGHIRVNGIEVGTGGKLIRDTGIIIEAPGFIPGFSGYKNLELLANINHRIDKKEIKNVLSQVGLNPEEKKPVRTYSMGMKQRLAIAQAVMEHPSILILDEPMNGLDDAGAQDIRKFLLGLKDNGITILIASHIKEDIDSLCDKVYKMDAGRISKVR